ncbi:hypothetical protein BC834DRAFT_1024361, partial [Gloeopeniophorella convolvens]
MSRPLPPPAVLAHVVDAHCHPTDAPALPDPSTLPPPPLTLAAMSTHAADQPRVAALARAHPDRVVPAFGYHPWWAHTISLAPPPAPPAEAHYRALFLPADGAHSEDLEAAFARLLPALPAPTPLATVLADVRAHLTAFPHAMLGEVGLDRAARVPFPATASASATAPRALSPFSTPLAHQLALLEAQLALAAELRRNVSLHSVKAPAQTQALLARMARAHGAAWRALSVDLHSCGLSPEVWRAIEKDHPNAFLSLSTAINGRSPNHTALIRPARRRACSSSRTGPMRAARPRARGTCSASSRTCAGGRSRRRGTTTTTTT